MNNIYTNLSELKARLFDLMDEREKHDEVVGKLEREIKSLLEEIEGVREELRVASNVADRRAEMIRDLVRENHELKREVSKQNGELTEEVIEEVTRVLKKSIEPPVSGVPYKGFSF